MEGELRDKDRALVRVEGEVVKAKERAREMEQALGERQREARERAEGEEDRVRELIAEKTAVEQRLENTRMVLARCEGYLREREEFKHLEGLVARLQGYIMMNRQGASGFTEEEKMIVRELFGVKPGSGNPEELRRRLV